jgi:hypothetical protein
MLQGHSDFVETFQQAGASEGIDFELRRETVNR